MSEWQPIETAPRDGTYVLVGRDMGEPWGFVRGTGYYIGEGTRVAGWVCRGINDPPGEFGLGNPTHWCPLPEAPLKTPPATPEVLP